MRLTTIVSAIALAAVCAGTAVAADKLPDKASTPAEQRFVAGASAALNKLYPTEQAAEAAGYFQYTNADRTGAISFVNPNYFTSTLEHPSQLWYSEKGALLGADYSVPKTATPPALFNLQPGRWFDFGAHVHWTLAPSSGKPAAEYATSVKKWLAAGGSLTDPSAATVVKLGKAKSTADVAHVFAFPNLWDTEIWVDDNPSGAFAQYNPNVKPAPKHKSKHGDGSGMM